jgi:hypothetical protein
MESIAEIRNRMEELLRQKEMLDAELGDAMVAAINDVAKENPNALKRTAKNVYVMNFSDFVNKPWNATYFDWEKSAEFIINFLKDKPKNEWCDVLGELLKKGNDDSIYFDKAYHVNGYRYVNRQPISRRFIELIIQRLK